MTSSPIKANNEIEKVFPDEQGEDQSDASPSTNRANLLSARDCAVKIQNLQDMKNPTVTKGREYMDRYIKIWGMLPKVYNDRNESEDFRKNYVNKSIKISAG